MDPVEMWWPSNLAQVSLFRFGFFFPSAVVILWLFSVWLMRKCLERKCEKEIKTLES